MVGGGLTNVMIETKQIFREPELEVKEKKGKPSNTVMKRQ